MRDMLPGDMARFRRIEQHFREVCLGWGYQEVRSPTIEYLHLFTAAGTLSPQMLTRVYSFLDWDGWSGERVVLRPDSTIPTARMYVEQLDGGQTAKLFYIQNVFRFAEDDRSREDWQCGVELIGDTAPLGDVELVMICAETLQRLGLSPHFRLSNPGILRTVMEKAGLDVSEQLVTYDRILQGDDSALGELQERLPELTASVTSLLTVEGSGEAYLNNLRTALFASVPEAIACVDELSVISHVLHDLGVPHSVRPVLVRSFEYYTGPVFYAYVGDEKVAGGGRYDGLIGLIGDAAVPASGFAIEFEPLMSLISDDEAITQASVSIKWAGAAGNGGISNAFALAQGLRRAGLSVHLSRAGVAGARLQVVVVPDGFELRLNGGKSRRFQRVEDVIAAVSSGTDA
jgi:histidyl-tRNA synthetase